MSVILKIYEKIGPMAKLRRRIRLKPFWLTDRHPVHISDNLGFCDWSDIYPTKMGVYFLFNEDDLLYIGYSKNISRRLYEHYSDETIPFEYVDYITDAGKFDDTEKMWRGLERALIIDFEPPYNNQYLKVI